MFLKDIGILMLVNFILILLTNHLLTNHLHRECQTDNPARAYKRLREILSSHEYVYIYGPLCCPSEVIMLFVTSARLAPVSFLFEKIGCVRVAIKRDENYDKAFESLWDAATEAGAEDFQEVNAESDNKEIEV